MRVLPGVAALAVLLILGAFVFVPSDTSEFDHEAVEAEVMEFLKEWMVSWERNDCAVITEFTHPEHAAMLYSGTVLSHESWKAECEPLVDNREVWTGEWNDVSIRVISPDAVAFVGTYWNTIEFKSGTRRHWPSVAQGGLVERTKAGWAITLLGNSAGAYEDVDG